MGFRTNTLIKEIKKIDTNLFFEQGDGCWCFIYDDPKNNIFETHSIYVSQLKQMPLETWVKEAEEFANKINPKPVRQEVVIDTIKGPTLYMYTVDAHDSEGIMTVEVFRDAVAGAIYVDEDGYGYPMKGGLRSKDIIKPSNLDAIPVTATHIVWYTR